MNRRVEWRDTRHAGWRRSYAGWTAEDVAFLNRTVGYEKYRIIEVPL